MPAFSTFVRSLPPHLVRRYLAKVDPDLRPEVNWDDERTAVARSLLKQHPGWDAGLRERIHADTGRVWNMADEAGQEALYGVWNAKAELDALSSGAARAMHIFLADQIAFRHAEAALFAEYGRYGRLWTAVACDSGLSVARDDAALSAFSEALRAQLQTANVHVEIYDRIRPTLEGDPAHLVQANLYREGRPDEDWQFIDGSLDRRTRRPVLEAAMTYEPATGIVEAVCRDRAERTDVLRLFYRHLLGRDFRDKQARLRLYNLTPLLSRCKFPTQLSDGIESVRVLSLRLVPHGTSADRVTLEVARDGARDIWSMAEERFGRQNPLLGGWNVSQARAGWRERSIQEHTGPGGEGSMSLQVRFVDRPPLEDREQWNARRQRELGSAQALLDPPSGKAAVPPADGDGGT